MAEDTDNADDKILMIVDPSYESIKLSSKVAEIGEKIDKPVYYIINKVTEKNVEKVKDRLKNHENICGVLCADEAIMESGLTGNELTLDNEAIIGIVDYLHDNFKKCSFICNPQMPLHGLTQQRHFVISASACSMENLYRQELFSEYFSRLYAPAP